MTTRGSSLIHKSVDTLRAGGFGSFCSKAARRVTESILLTNCADWYCVELQKQTPKVARPNEAEITFDATEEVVAWLAELQPSFPWVWDEHEVAEARTCGHALPLMHVDGDRAGFIMVGLSRAYVTDFQRCITIPSHTAFIYDTFVHPDFRGRGLAAWAISQTIDFLRQRDMRFLWCHIPDWNRASIRSFEKCGFTKVAHVRHIRLFGWKLYTRRPETLLREMEATANSA